MSPNPEGSQRSESGLFSLAKLTLLSLLTGAVIGLVVGCFRVALEHMNTARTDTIAWAHPWPVPGVVLVCSTVAATTAFAAWLVQRSRQPAAGRGIPHAETVIEGTLPAAPILLLPIADRIALFVAGAIARFATHIVGGGDGRSHMGGHIAIYDSMKARTIGVAKAM